MNKSDYENPEKHMFYCDKNDWWVEGKKNKKIWDQGKVKEFWEKVRNEKMLRQDYDFKGFIFPKFSNTSFWNEGEERIFKKYVSFRSVKFTGLVDLRQIHFQRCVSFNFSKFNEEAFFNKTNFLDKTFFQNVTFTKKAFFSEVIFENYISFISTQFITDVDFRVTSFKGISYFKLSAFLGNSDFRSSTFSEYADFRSSKFTGNVYFTEVAFLDNAYFRSSVFSSFVSFKSNGFSKNIDCSKTIFSGQVDFTDTEFLGEVNFQLDVFRGALNFTNSTFFGDTNYQHSEFTREVDCSSVTFVQDVNFSDTKFSGRAKFNKTSFQQGCYFKSAQFLEDIDFSDATFNDRLEFHSARFQNELNLKGAFLSFLKSLDKRGCNLDGAILEETHFFGIDKLENISFKNTFLLSLNLSSKELLNCDLTGAMIGAVQTRGWKPDKATLRNTKYIYTDFNIINNSEPKFSYQIIENSRVPADGEFGIGDNEGFTLADYLHDPIKWSYALPLPKEIRTGFLNYIRFFEDFLRVTENEEVEIQPKREGKKVRVEFMIDNFEKKQSIQELFGRYMRNITEDNSDFYIDFRRSKADALEQEILIIDYKNQIRQLQNDLENKILLIKQKQKTIELLEEKNLLQKRINVLEGIQKYPLTFTDTTLQLLDVLSCDDLKIKYAEGRDNHKKIFQQLESRLSSGELRNQYFNLKGAYKNLQDAERNGLLSYEKLTEEKSRITERFFSLLDYLKENNIIEE